MVKFSGKFILLELTLKFSEPDAKSASHPAVSMPTQSHGNPASCSDEESHGNLVELEVKMCTFWVLTL